MNKMDAISLALNCGAHEKYEIIYMNLDEIVKFANESAKAERNRLADELQKMPLNDTANSIAIWIRNQE